MRLSSSDVAAIAKSRSSPIVAAHPKEKLYAKGRLAAAELNKTEARFADHLESQRLAGEVAWWRHHAIVLKIAPNTHVRIDFQVMMADGEFRFIDTKGAPAVIQDDSHAKFKVAAAMFPFRFFYAFPIAGGGWTLEEVNGK